MLMRHADIDIPIGMLTSCYHLGNLRLSDFEPCKAGRVRIWVQLRATFAKSGTRVAVRRRDPVPGAFYRLLPLLASSHLCQGRFLKRHSEASLWHYATCERGLEAKPVSQDQDGSCRVWSGQVANGGKVSGSCRGSWRICEEAKPIRLDCSKVG